MNIDEARKRAQELGELAAADPEFRKRAESDPRGTMIEHGIPEALVDDILNEPDVEGYILFNTISCAPTMNCGKTIGGAITPGSSGVSACGVNIRP